MLPICRFRLFVAASVLFLLFALVVLLLKFAVSRLFLHLEKPLLVIVVFKSKSTDKEQTCLNLNKMGLKRESSCSVQIHRFVISWIVRDEWRDLNSFFPANQWRGGGVGAWYWPRKTIYYSVFLLVSLWTTK